jgi:hypothetical protein
MRIRATLIAAVAASCASLALAAAATAAPTPAAQPLVITADNVRQAHGVSTWTGHVTVSGMIDPARTALTVDGKPSAVVDLSTLPPLAAAALTEKRRAGKRARLDLTTQR